MRRQKYLYAQQKVLKFKEEKCAGIKQFNEMIAVHLCTNMTGRKKEKEKEIMVHK